MLSLQVALSVSTLPTFTFLTALHNIQHSYFKANNYLYWYRVRVKGNKNGLILPFEGPETLL